MFVSRNDTPFLAESFPALDKHGVKRLVAVVKATFEVDEAGTCHPAGEQVPFVYADTPYGDPEKTAMRSETDFAPFKPKAEVVLNASAHAPGGRSAQEVEVALIGPGIDKRAIVSGDRRWLRGGLGFQMSQPTPFSQIPLGFHLTFGGTDFSFEDPADIQADLRNPIGAGFQANGDPAAVEARPLPNIEHPEHRMASWDDRPLPIGFGPVPRMARERQQFAGTYDQNWMDNILPFLPPDFDERYFMTAQQDQWLDALNPGMTFLCAHMTPAGRWQFRLPDLPVVVEFNFGDRLVVQAPRPDTVILEPDGNRVILLARTGVVLPRQFTQLTDVRVGRRQGAMAGAG